MACTVHCPAAVWQVNQIMLNYQWSNITFDSLAVENLAPGDAKSAELARPLSVSSANNFGSLYYNRTQDRLLLKNVTVVFGSQVCGMTVVLVACKHHMGHFGYALHSCTGPSLNENQQ